MKRSKQTKRALTSSVLALVLCFVMLLGTTFAWFTDNASTNVNKVQAGTLDVALEMKQGDNWVSAEGKTLNFTDKNGKTDILWEPGATFKLPAVRIVNNGNLALKYQVAITAVSGDNSLAEVLYVTQTEVVKGENENKTYTTDPVTLKSLMTSNDGVITDVKVLKPNESTGELTISMTMDQNAGNQYQDKSIEGIAITVLATQDTVENDSNNNEYDKDATYLTPWDGVTTENPTLKEDGKYHITSAAEFVAYIKNTNTGNSYVLDRDIDLGGYTIDVSSGSRVCGSNFDGQNYTVSNFTLKGGMYTSLFGYMTIYESGRTIENLIVRNATVIGGAQTSVILSAANKNDAAGAATVNNCKVYDSTIIGEKKVAPIVGYTESGTITNCYAENCTVYCADNRSEQAGEVVGYINVSGGHTDNTSDNTAKNVTVSYGVSSHTGGNVTLSKSDNVGYVADATVTVSVDGGYNRICSDNATFVNCVFNGRDTDKLWFKDSATFINCTFNVPIDNAEPVEGTIKFENCTFNKYVHFAPASKDASENGKYFVAEDCIFNGSYDASGNANRTALTVQGFELVTLKNCKLQGLTNWSGKNMISYCPLTLDHCTFTTGIRLSYAYDSSNPQVTCTNGTVALSWANDGSATVGTTTP